MRTRKLSFLEKLPVYIVAYSVLWFFVTLPTISLGMCPFSDVCIAALKTRLMFIFAFVGAVLTICMCVVRVLKKSEKTYRMRLANSLLVSLA
jgi:hypothetical protein